MSFFPKDLMSAVYEWNKSLGQMPFQDHQRLEEINKGQENKKSLCKYCGQTISAMRKLNGSALMRKPALATIRFVLDQKIMCRSFRLGILFFLPGKSTLLCI
jgi:hypothetical protein